ncbi:DUF1064 domain-containing protein [Lacticaseibacillus suibinensis]|uniref:DUF1064 domain-containing protein n=1 Tax=Lacticaseibacillus suibinensis TaxID=2486011 RepID=UPI000F76D264|nr:DUF1064 domain-containing protein [Lacticaseibacillus suibinensis]
MTWRGHNKYHANKTETADGKIADSMAEAAYYNQLLRQDVRFTYHQSFEILQSFTLNRKQYSKRVYTPDFCIYEGEKLVKVVDVKGGNATMTTDAKLRIAIFMRRYGLPVTVARYDYKTGLFSEEQA